MLVGRRCNIGIVGPESQKRPRARSRIASRWAESNVEASSIVVEEDRMDVVALSRKASKRLNKNVKRVLDGTTTEAAPRLRSIGKAARE